MCIACIKKDDRLTFRFILHTQSRLKLCHIDHWPKRILLVICRFGNFERKRKVIQQYSFIQLFKNNKEF